MVSEIFSPKHHVHVDTMLNRHCACAYHVTCTQIERKISKSNNLQNFDLLGALEIRGYEKLWFLLQKTYPCVNPRRLSHFAWKLVEGPDLSGCGGKKSKKVTRGSHRNDVSPLTQGLRYRAACEMCCFVWSLVIQGSAAGYAGSNCVQFLLKLKRTSEKHINPLMHTVTILVQL